MPILLKDIERFENKFTKSSPDLCWNWKAGLFKCGYGQFRSKYSKLAHRFSYILYAGPVPDELCVLHKCDNKSCVNPSHLFLGTNLDNTKDMVSKGRDNFGCSKGPGENVCKGEKVTSSKLTEEDVLEIRRRYKRKSYHSSNSRQLASEFRVCQDHIGRLVNRGQWKHI